MSERLNQQDLIDFLAEKHGMDKKNADKFVKEFFLLIEEALEKDRYVKIKGFGTFKLVDIESRESVNVNTGERFQLQGYTKVAFTPDGSLRDLINKPFAHFETVVLNENTVLDDTPFTVSDDESEELEMPEEEIGFQATEIVKPENDNQERINVTEEVFTEQQSENIEGVENNPSEENSSPVEVNRGMEESSFVTEQSENTAEEIIARELTVASVPEEIKKEAKRDVAKEKDEIKSNKTDKSPVPYLVAIILVVLLLCGGALFFIYYPDIFESDDHQQEPIENSILSTPVHANSQDTIVKEDTVAEVISPVKEEVAISAKKKSEIEKKGTKAVAKPAPFKPDSVGYIITGTKTTYTIKEGETLTKVALRFYGTKALWPYIVKHNPDLIKNPDNVPYGTTIKIPELVKK